MFFLLRAAFWFSLVLLMLPFNLGGESDEATVGPIETFFAVREAVADMRGMCERKPDVCRTGGAAFHTIGVRAREAARIGYDLIGDEGEEPTTVDEAVTGTVLPATAPRPTSKG